MIRIALIASVLTFLLASFAQAQDPRPEQGFEQPAPRKLPKNRTGHREVASSSGSDFGLHKVTFDLGVSAGSVASRSYTEANFGLNIYFAEWLAWRNAVFARFIEGTDNVYGLDTSVRGIFNADGGALGFTAFAGPGYRFINGGSGQAPFVEGGLVLRLAGIAVGGGLKTVYNSWVRKDDPNDTQYFIILSGGGSL